MWHKQCLYEQDCDSKEAQGGYRTRASWGRQSSRLSWCDRRHDQLHDRDWAVDNDAVEFDWRNIGLSVDGNM